MKSGEKFQPCRQLVDHHRAAHDGIGAGERDLLVADGKVRRPVLGDDDVAQVPRVAIGVGRRAVVRVARIEVTAGGGAPAGGVAERVDVEAVLAGREAGDVAAHGGGAVGAGLREGDGAGDQGLPHTRPLFSSNLRRFCGDVVWFQCSFGDKNGSGYG